MSISESQTEGPPWTHRSVPKEGDGDYDQDSRRKEKNTKPDGNGHNSSVAACFQKRSVRKRLLRGKHVDPGADLFLAGVLFVLDHAVDQGEQGVVLAQSHVFAWVDSGAQLGGFLIVFSIAFAWIGYSNKHSIMIGTVADDR